METVRWAVRAYTRVSQDTRRHYYKSATWMVGIPEFQEKYSPIPLHHWHYYQSGLYYFFYSFLRPFYNWPFFPRFSNHTSPTIIKILYNTKEFRLPHVAPSYVKKKQNSHIITIIRSKILHFCPFFASITSILKNLEKLLKTNFLKRLTLKI